jgi:hypothetical protein
MGWIRARTNRSPGAKTAVASTPSSALPPDPAYGVLPGDQDREALLAANAKKELEDLVALLGKQQSLSGQEQFLSDKEQYIIGVKSVLSRFLREKFQIDGTLDTELADIVYLNTQDQALTEQIQEVYARCSRLLYSPSDLTGADTSLAEAVSLIVEKCETHKNINGLP